MDIVESLGSFIESSGSPTMPGAATQLVELLEADEVEPLDQPGTSVTAEELAERLEQRIERLRKKGPEPTGIQLVEDAIALLRANEGITISPWTYEDSDGVRWFVLANEDEDDEIIACYTSAPFIEADI